MDIDQLDRIEGLPPLIPPDNTADGAAGSLAAELVEDAVNFLEEDYSEFGSAVIVDNPALPATIDVMVVYTPAARTWAGGTGGMNNVINLAMSIAQTSLTNSATGITMPLVHRAEVSYTESGSGITDLNRLTGTGDGYMDEVHTWRDTHGADLVALFAHVTYGGIGWMPSAFPAPDYGFSVSRVQQVASGATHIHEMGHNMGAHHSRLQNHQRGPNTALNSYSSGPPFYG